MRVLLLLSLACLLGGCVGPTDVASPPHGADPPSGAPNPTRPALSNPEIETGDVAGRVLGPDGPLAGANLRLQGLPLATTSGPSGAFAFTGLKPGTYTLEARAAGHTASSTRADIRAGSVTEVAITMAREAGAAGPLLADFWGGRSEAVVADGTYSRSDGAGMVLEAFDYVPVLGFCRSTATDSEEQLIPIHFDDDHQLVWPGTAAMTIQVSWDPVLYPGPVHLQIDPKPGVNITTSPDVANGGSHTFEVLPGWADLPYQRFSSWTIGICLAPSGSQPIWPQILDFQAKVTLVRGHPLPVLGAPEDLYGSQTRVLLVDEVKQGDDPFDLAYLAVPHDRTRHEWRFELADGTKVPPGTAYLEAYLEWDWGGGDVSLSYVSAAIHPRFHGDWSKHLVPEPVESGPGFHRYRIALTADDWDGADDNRTAWRFWWNEAGQEANAQGQIPPEPWTVGLRVVAVSMKDPGA
jgi:hypothetical protein